MAVEKKSFVIYSDLIFIVEKLVLKDRENKTNYGGELFLHILEYVNDKKPIPIDFIIEMAFEPIRLQLKRDLEKYQAVKQKRSDAGKQGGRPKKEDSENVNEEAKKANALFEKQDEAKKAVNDNDNDNVTDTDTDNVILLKKETKKDILVEKSKKFNFRLELLDYGFLEHLVDDWLIVRKNKKASNTATSFKTFINEIESRNCNINDMLQIAVSNSWSGFQHKWVDNLKSQNQNGNRNNNQSKTDADHRQDANDAVNRMYGITG